MKQIRQLVLFLIVCNIPSFALAYFGSGLGSIASYFSILVCFAYYFMDKRGMGQLALPFLFLGVLYFALAGLNYSGNQDGIYYLNFLKFGFITLGGYAIVRNTGLKELYLFLCIGALSIVLNTLVFPTYNAGFTENYGRFSGFYMNPNYAGAICLIGYSLSFAMKNPYHKYIGQLVFTLGGFFTFSRFFLIMWVLLNMLTVIQDRKNLKVPLLGGIAIFLVFALSGKLSLNQQRFQALESIFSDNVDTKTLNDGSRTETWKSYSDVIMNKPLLGNGYKKLHGHHFGIYAGVHNSYLMVLGEAGIVPFMVMIFIYSRLLFLAYKQRKERPELLLLAVTLCTELLVSHNYFDRYSVLFVTFFLYYTLKQERTLLIEEKN